MWLLHSAMTQPQHDRNLFDIAREIQHILNSNCISVGSHAIRSLNWPDLTSSTSSSSLHVEAAIATLVLWSPDFQTTSSLAMNSQSDRSQVGDKRTPARRDSTQMQHLKTSNKCQTCLIHQIFFILLFILFILFFILVADESGYKHICLMLLMWLKPDGNHKEFRCAAVRFGQFAVASNN